MHTQYSKKRWLIALMGVVLQMALGTVYAWSYFQQPVMQVNNWSNSEAAWAFCLAIFFLGLSAAWGGAQLDKLGPRRLAMLGGGLFGSGYLLAAYALAQKELLLLYFGYGLVGGLGLGLGYVTPVATVARWFPDRKGLMTGLVVMGFGLGALLMAKGLAPYLMTVTGSLAEVFTYIGLAMLAITLPAGFCLTNPPAAKRETNEAGELTSAVRQCLVSSRFILLWLVFFCNIVAGIILITFQSPLLQDLMQKALPAGEVTAAGLAAAGATLIGASSLCNGLGRLLWGGLSDKIGRLKTFICLLGSQILVFIMLPSVDSPLLFSGLVCYILLCYGGGFGAMPSLILEMFGPRYMAPVYGAVLTAWGCGGIAGPQAAAVLKDNFGAQAAQYIFVAATAVLLFGFLCALRLYREDRRAAETQYTS